MCISGSMEQDFNWLDNFIKLCEVICPEGTEEYPSPEPEGDCVCAYCGTPLGGSADGGEGCIGAARHICRACLARQVIDTGQCQTLIKETAQNVKSLFGFSLDLEWDVSVQRMPRKWNWQRGKREAQEMPWERDIRIRHAKKNTCRLVLKGEAPDGVISASIVYFLCVQHLTGGNSGVELQMRGLAEWFVANYLRILDMEGLASQYEQLWSAQKLKSEKGSEEDEADETGEDGVVDDVSSYDFWVRQIGAPTAKNTVTIDKVKPLIQKQRKRSKDEDSK